jgi:serine/threonine protein kinase
VDLNSPLGRGSFGTVYKATLNNTEYAMKLLDLITLEDCLEEVKIQCQLKHAFVVEIIDFYTGEFFSLLVCFLLNPVNLIHLLEISQLRTNFVIIMDLCASDLKKYCENYEKFGFTTGMRNLALIDFELI